MFLLSVASTWPRPPHPDSSRQYSPSASPGSKRTSPTVRTSGRQSPGKEALSLVNTIELTNVCFKA